MNERSRSRCKDRSPKQRRRKREEEKQSVKERPKRHHKRRDRKDKSVSTEAPINKMHSLEQPKSEEKRKERRKSTQDAGHYEYTIGEVINNQYKIISHISDGTFGRCFEVTHINNNQSYAIKIIRGVERYVRSAKEETSILQQLQQLDPHNQYMLKFYTAFPFQSNYVMVFEHLSESLYQLLHPNNSLPSLKTIQRYTKQVLEQLAFLHKQGITHTDLKPENILITDGSKENVKIIDYGNATREKEHHSRTINTRLYRAPEVLMGCCQWDNKSDLWSLGCIFYELLFGTLLFSVESHYEHLAQIEKRTARAVPQWMSRRVKDELEMCVNSSTQQYNKYGTYLNWPKYVSDISRVRKVKQQKSIKNKLQKAIDDDYLRGIVNKFIDGMLTIDPHKRLSCNQLLASDFINYKFPNKEKKTNDKKTVDRNKEESMEKDMEKEDEFKPKIQSMEKEETIKVQKEQAEIEIETSDILQEQKKRKKHFHNYDVKSDQVKYGSNQKQSEEIQQKVTKSLELNIQNCNF